MIFHKSQYGMFATGFAADLRGFVGTTVEDVLKLEWPETPTRDQALDIALGNTLVQTAAIARIEAWREPGAPAAGGSQHVR
jgi:hypothetical protein